MTDLGNITTFATVSTLTDSAEVVSARTHRCGRRRRGAGSRLLVAYFEIRDSDVHREAWQPDVLHSLRCCVTLFDMTAREHSGDRSCPLLAQCGRNSDGRRMETKTSLRRRARRLQNLNRTLPRPGTHSLDRVAMIWQDIDVQVAGYNFQYSRKSPTSRMYRSRSSQNGVWLHSSNRTHLA
jgi:hypothetical protein